MSSTFPGSFQQPPPRQPPAQARRPDLAVGRGNDGQRLTSQAVEGASNTEVLGLGEVAGKDGTSLGSPLVDIGIGSARHSRTTSKTSNGSILSPRNEPDSKLPIQFPPKPILDALWRRNHSSSWSPASNIASNVNGNETRVLFSDAPAISKVYPQSQPADFSPWRGMSFEDNISEQTIKSGFQNKPLITNESNTARPSLWSQLKKNGPTMLSSLFVNLLEKRQSNGRLTAPWNFKLPPLLTMTPTRRESFLHELADPTWPLRKLMRSLPRGVGGKVLLDQCLDKFIPTPRAVWLAKCIGAHDLRAIKRKSTTSTSAANSEAKWVKEWTMHVEQFIKAAISAVGDANWKSKVDYVLRLSAHLFSGRLLDEDHFLDWILTSLETSTFDQLPVWLLLVRIYTKPIVSSRRRGKRLAEALLCHLDEQDYSADFDDLTQPVIQMVQDTLSTLAKTKSMCFLFSRNWNKFRGLLQAISERAVSLDVKQAIADIACRNERISGQFSIKSSPGASEQIIRLLDSEGLKIPSNKLASRCLELISDVAVLLDIIMRWAASPYRQGRHRVYLAARLLRAISDQERDIDEIIWAVVEKHGNNPAMHESDLFQVVIELIRPRHFSVGKFLQHLIATGAFSHIESAHNSPLVRLLKQIPDHDVSEGVSNLRANLLESAGLESFVETEIYLEVQKCVDSQLAQVGISANIESLTPLPHLTALSQNQKFALGLWLRGKMIEAYENSVDFEPVPDGLLSGKVVMSVFFIIRHALEQLQEYPCLADVIGLLLGTSNQSLLTSLSQTLHYGYRSFIAMGAMKSLFERLTATYEGLRTPAPLERPFCVALLELCSSLQATKSLVTQITQDLVRCDQLFAAVCSPASDLTADTPAAGGVEFDADLDRVLLSGTTMDQLTFERMFKRISGRMEEAYREDATLTVPAGTWLSRLRAFDPSNFDLLTHKWVSSLLSSLHDQQCLYSYVLPILLGSSSMSFLDFLKLAKSLQNSSTSESISFQIQSKINRITALLPGMGPVTDIGIVESYKYKLERKMFASNAPGTVLSLLTEAISIQCPPDMPDVLAQLKGLLQSSEIIYLLRQIICSSQPDMSNVRDILSLSMESQFGAFWVDSLLDPQTCLHLRNMTLHGKIGAIIGNLDELSLDFSSLALQAFQRQRLSTSDHIERFVIAMLDHFVEAGSLNRLKPIHYELLMELELDTRRQLFEACETRFLDIPDLTTAGTSNQLCNMFETYMCIMNHTLDSVNHERDTEASVCILDRFRKISQVFSDPHVIENKQEEDENPLHKERELLKTWIKGLLNLSLAHNLPTSSSGTSKSSTLDLLNIISYVIGSRLLYQTFPQTMQYLVDVAAVSIDSLTDEQRLSFAKADPSRSSDPLLIYLLDVPTNIGCEAWLSLVMSAAQQASGHAQIGTPISSQQSQSQSQGQVRAGATRSPAAAGTPQSSQSTQPQPPRGPLIGPRQTGSGQPGIKAMTTPIPFPLKPWEMLPDQGNAAAINDTAISLALFSARRV